MSPDLAQFLREIQPRILALESQIADLRALSLKYLTTGAPAIPHAPRQLSGEDICNLVTDYVALFYRLDRQVFFQTARNMNGRDPMPAGHRKPNRLAEIRWQCQSLARHFSRLGVIKLGAFFHCHHTTIVFGCTRCIETISVDPAYQTDYETLFADIAKALTIARSTDPAAALESLRSSSSVPSGPTGEVLSVVNKKAA